MNWPLVFTQYPKCVPDAGPLKLLCVLYAIARCAQRTIMREEAFRDEEDISTPQSRVKATCIEVRHP
jgi:hypothetical protein